MSSAVAPAPAAPPRRGVRRYTHDVAIVGGLGHVGLPLGIAFAAAGLRVCLIDRNRTVADRVLAGTMPFIEYGAEPLLREALRKGRLTVSMDPACVAQAPRVIVAVGTPVDEYLNPRIRHFVALFETLRPHLRPDQLIAIRSTVCPGTCRRVLRLLQNGGDAAWHLAYCPERIEQGYAIRQLSSLPQIVAGVTPHACRESSRLFGRLTRLIIPLSLEEAELAKLFCNSWRYVKFALANQFYMMAHRCGADFERIRHAMTEGYEFLTHFPTAGFAAGPCLLKDTMQLAAFSGNTFVLGHAAMLINEGLPAFLVEDLEREGDLAGRRVGILGMAFKAGVDDIRDSLSYKLRKILVLHGARVLCSDEFVKDPDFVPMAQVAAECEIVIVGVPHPAYRRLRVPAAVRLVDLWNVIPRPRVSVAPRAARRAGREVGHETRIAS